MRRLMADHVVQRLTVREDLTRLRRAAELGIKASNRLHLLLELIGDVDDERRLAEILAKAHAVNQFARAMLRQVGRELGETGNEARVADELRRGVMIGVPPFPRRRDDDL